jgi:DNA repair protein RadC
MGFRCGRRETSWSISGPGWKIFRSKSSTSRFWTQHRLERDVTVTRGILNSSLVHPREVFREAIAERAAAIVLVHNHPSGDPAPSLDDRVVTEQLVAAGRLLDIPVHDHVIIGRGRYTSFAEAGLL